MYCIYPCGKGIFRHLRKCAKKIAQSKAVITQNIVQMNIRKVFGRLL